MNLPATSCGVSKNLSFSDLPALDSIGGSGNPACPRESGELLMNWIPVYTGNPGLSGQAG